MVLDRKIDAIEFVKVKIDCDKIVQDVEEDLHLFQCYQLYFQLGKKIFVGKHANLVLNANHFPQNRQSWQH